jgi:nitrogen regulation protein NR(I)
MSSKILLIEDDLSAGAAFQKVLASEGYAVTLVNRAEDGLVMARDGQWDLVVTDLRLPRGSGLDLIRVLHSVRPRLPIILMTAHGSTETAIEATKLGACEYLVKPFEADELLALVAESVRQSKLMTTAVELGGATTNTGALIGISRSMQEVFKQIGRVAATPVTVLIRGETGTGKELVARAIYQHSDRASGPFIAVNCAAIPKLLLESELFGHERGAFTGAHQRRIGRFEQARGGTLFLDEIGDLSADTQVKLLRVLQERQIQRVGGNETIAVDVRILAATHRNLDEAIQAREFREDLFYRLSVMTISIPPLRERPEDIPELVTYFFRRHAQELGVSSPSIQPDALELLKTQPWPGNVRELENVVRQGLLQSRPYALGPDHVRAALSRARRAESVAGQTFAEYVNCLLTRVERGEEHEAHTRMISDLEAELFSQAIKRAEGNQTKAALWLGVTRLKMREKLTELGLRPSGSSSNVES